MHTAAKSLSLRDKTQGIDFKAWLAIIALPLVLTSLNDSWIFGRPVAIDRWIYSGLHLHLPVLLQRFPNTYYVSREPWDFLGWAVHRLLPPEPALYVLHLSVLYLSAFALYAAIRLLFDSDAAFIATALLCVQAPFLVAAGWDYVDGFYVACLMVTLAALFGVVVGEHWRSAAVLWGIAATFAVSTYAFWAVLVLVELAIFILFNRFENRRSLLAAAVYFTSGAIGSIVILGLLNVSLGGPFFYFWPQLAALRSVAANNPRWFEPVSVWANHLPYAIASAATWLYSIVLLAWASVDSSLLAENRSIRRRLQMVCGMNVAALAMFIAFQVCNFALFQFEEYVNALLPFAFITVGGAIAAADARINRRSARALVYITYGIVVVPWLLSAFHVTATNSQLFYGAVLGISWSFVGCSVLLLGLLKPRAGVILSVSVFTILGFEIIGSPGIGRMSVPANPAFKQQTLAVFDTSTIVGRYNKNGAARFWFNADDPLAVVEQDVNSTYLADYTKINDRFPDPRAANAMQPIQPGDRIVIMTSKAIDPIALADRSLVARHVVLKEVANEEIRRPGVAFRVVIADAELDPRFQGERLSLITAERNTTITTPHTPWAYGALLQIPKYDRESDYRNAVVRLRVRAIHGRFWVGVLAASGSSFLARKELDLGSQLQDAVFTGINLKNAGGIVIQNGPVADAGRIELDSAEMLLPKISVERAGRRS